MKGMFQVNILIGTNLDFAVIQKQGNFPICTLGSVH